MRPPLPVGLLGFDDVVGLDLIAPIEAFTCAGLDSTNGRDVPFYETLVTGSTNQPFISTSELIFQPQMSIAEAPALDTLIILGGRIHRSPEVQKRVVGWIKDQISATRRIAAVSNGVYWLAESNLLNGRNVAAH